VSAFIAYCRVFTERPGPSELGLEAQREAAACFMIAYLVYDLVTGKRQRTKG